MRQIRVLPTPTPTTPASTHRPMKDRKVDNSGRHFNATISMDDARAIRESYLVKREATMEELAVKYGLSKNSVFHIIKGNTYKETVKVSKTRVC
jgi:hypothetical protein